MPLFAGGVERADQTPGRLVEKKKKGI